jgi:hypothetical protein
MGEPRRELAESEVRTLLGGLNPVQQEAVLHVDGPLLVLAGAGSGKTRVIAQRIAYLVARGVDPRQILAVTFTNKAAGEMAQRVAAILASRPGGGRPPLVATFHSTCARVLRSEIHHLGYRRSFVIYDEDDRLALVRECYKELGLDERLLTPAAAVARISRAKNQLRSPEEVEEHARGPREAEVARLYTRYAARLRAVGAVDFDDLLGLTVELFTRHPERAGLLPQPLAVRARRRVPGHERRAVPAPAPAHGGAPEPLRRGGSGPVHLPVPGRGPPEHPGLRARLPGLPGRPPRAELPLDGAHSRDRRGRDRAQPGAQGEGLWTENARGEPARLFRARDEAEEALWIARTVAELRARASRSTASPFSTARTPSRACWRTRSASRGCPTTSWAACASTSAGRSRTRSRTSGS